MAENCPFYKQGKCAPPGGGAQVACSWSFPAYQQCNVYVMEAVAAGGGGMADQLRAIGALSHGAQVTGLRQRPAPRSDPVPAPPSRASSPPPAREPVLVTEKTKDCPTCGKKLKAAAEACPTCEAKFEVYTLAYCTHCHKLIHTSADGKCPDCGGSELLDPRLYSKMTAAGTPPAKPGAKKKPEAATAAAALAASAPAAVSIPAETKQCPRCAETIKAEARLCRYCGARFEVAVKGYCANCHTEVILNENDKCSRCGGDIIDRHVASTLVDAPASSAAPVSVPPASGSRSAAMPVPAAIPIATIAAVTASPVTKIHMPLWQLYLSPKGRIGRLTFFLKGMLPVWGVMTVIVMIMAQTANTSEMSGTAGTLMGIASLLILSLYWVMLMLIVKRFHDLGRSGWNILMWLIPVFGQFIALGNQIEFYFRKGTGPNQFGDSAD